MRHTFFQGITLGKVRIFALKDLWLFIIGVLLISMTSAAIGAFISGVKPREFFLGEAEDILVVTPPGVATPMTGYLPVSLTHDINQLTGVKAISPEVLGIVVAQNLNDRAIIIRGITNDFLNLTPYVNMKGNWFDQLSKETNNTRTVFEAAAGVTLANDQGLNIGSKLTLVSTLVPMTIDLTITGILTTGTPIDSELIVPLTIAQVMTGRYNDYVSFLRVKINTSILTKTQLTEIINGVFQVPLLVQSNDPAFENDLKKIPLTVYSLAGELIRNQSLDSNGRTTFELPFGTYRFLASPSFTKQCSIEVFVNRTITSPIILWIGKTRHNLIVNVTYNNQPIVNATVTIRDKFHPTKDFNASTPSDGIFSFDNLTDSYYEVSADYNGFSEERLVHLNVTRELKITFENSLRISIINITNGEEMNGGAIQLLNASNPNQIVYPRDTTNNQSFSPYNSGEVIYIDDPNTYLINYTIRNRQRTWYQTIFGNTSNMIYVGKAELLINVYSFEGDVLENSNVSVSLDGKIIDYKQTNNEGIVSFQLEIGKYYKILAQDPEKRNESKILFFNSPITTSINFKPIDIYWIETRVYNGTVENEELSGLASSTLVISNSSGTINTTLTNYEGVAKIALTNPGRYSLNVTYHEYSWLEEIIVSQETTQVKIPLGDVKLKIITRTSSNYPIANCSVTILKEGDYWAEITTNNNGEGLSMIPLGDYSLVIEKAEFREKFDVSFKVSQIYTLKKVFDLTGILVFEVVNSQGQGLGGVTLSVKNVHYSFTISGITDHNSEIVFYDLPWGNYSVTTMYEDMKYDVSFVGFAQIEKRVIVQVTIPIKILEETTSLLKWRGHVNIIVVEPENFLSGFLLTTLEVATTALIALIIVVTALSMLSVSSVISYPIILNQRNVIMTRILGGSERQIYFIIVFQLIIIGLIASIVGGSIGILIMTFNPLFRTTNVGGLIIIPIARMEILLGITISVVLIILVKTKTTLSEIFTI